MVAAQTIRRESTPTATLTKMLTCARQPQVRNPLRMLPAKQTHTWGEHHERDFGTMRGPPAFDGHCIWGGHGAPLNEGPSSDDVRECCRRRRAIVRIGVGKA